MGSPAEHRTARRPAAGLTHGVEGSYVDGSGKVANEVHDRMRTIRRCKVSPLGVAALAALLMLGGALAMPAAATTTTPTWKLHVYRNVGGENSFKCDLIQELKKPPQVLIFGGSRAMRFEGTQFTKLTGLQGFNAAVEVGRPEDAWAFTNFVHDLYPDVKLHCFWALQATSFTNHILHPGLVEDPRLSKYFPQSLINQMKPHMPQGPPGNLLSSRHFSGDGTLTWNIYDVWRSQGRTLDESLNTWLAQMIPIAASKKVPKETRSKQYFEMTLKMFNDMGARPVLVIMPYQPRALAAFEKVGWMAKENRLINYLNSLKKTYSFKVLNFLWLKSFHGDPNAFYDGAHVTVKNARLIVAQAVKEAPGCFK